LAEFALLSEFISPQRSTRSSLPVQITIRVLENIHEPIVLPIPVITAVAYVLARDINNEAAADFVASLAATEPTLEIPCQEDYSPGVATDLIGAWEIGGGLPAQTNPITGEASGISFVEARRLEIFPEGTFKHVQSHRHCEGSGLRRCCEEQAILEQGGLSIDDRRITSTSRVAGRFRGMAAILL